MLANVFEKLKIKKELLWGCWKWVEWKKYVSIKVMNFCRTEKLALTQKLN